MKILVKNKGQAVRYAMIQLLTMAVMKEKYEGLQWLYETAKLNNDKLVKQLKAERTISQLPAKTVFTDIAHILYQESEKRPEIIEYCYEFYARKYPKAILEFENAEKHYLETESIHPGFCKNVMLTSDHILRQFAFFLIFRSDIIKNKEIYIPNLQQYFEVSEFAIGTDTESLSESPVFNTGEKIWESKQFKKFLEKQKERLAELMREELHNPSITKDNVGKYLGDELKSKAGPIPLINAPLTMEAVTKWTSTRILVKHHGAITWMEKLTNDGSRGYFEPFNYKPDMDFIIETYYRELVHYYSTKNLEKNREYMSKLYLSRYCEPLVQADCVSIMYMYYIDVICKLLEQVMEKYYEYFSWEKIVDKKENERYKAIITQLEKDKKEVQEELAETLEQISQLKRENKEQIIELQRKNREDSAKEILPYERTITGLNKKIQEKDSQIDSLRDQLASQNEYIELLLANEEPESEITIDIEKLKHKRYLFVGHIKEALPQLYAQFSNSLFMENETFDLKNIKVDGIVMLIKYMSHSMFYKVNATSALAGIPVVRCNTKNIDTVYSKMQELL